MNKLTKDQVDYSRGKPNAHCSICVHWLGAGMCEIVSGPIAPEMWCEKFKRRMAGFAVTATNIVRTAAR